MLLLLIVKYIYKTFHARKSFLYNEGETWIKKQSNNFDVTMGSLDGAEVCELIGIFILSLIGDKYNPNSIGLHWQFSKIQAAHNLKKFKKLF